MMQLDTISKKSFGDALTNGKLNGVIVLNVKGNRNTHIKPLKEACTDKLQKLNTFVYGFGDAAKI